MIESVSSYRDRERKLLLSLKDRFIAEIRRRNRLVGSLQVTKEEAADQFDRQFVDANVTFAEAVGILRTMITKNDAYEERHGQQR